MISLTQSVRLLTANSACSLCVLLTMSRSCCRVSGRPADNRYSLATASLGVTTATFRGSTEPRADMSNTRETLEPRLEGEVERGMKGRQGGRNKRRNDEEFLPQKRWMILVLGFLKHKRDKKHCSASFQHVHIFTHSDEEVKSFCNNRVQAFLAAVKVISISFYRSTRRFYLQRKCVYWRKYWNFCSVHSFSNNIQIIFYNIFS